MFIAVSLRKNVHNLSLPMLFFGAIPFEIELLLECSLCGCVCTVRVVIILFVVRMMQLYAAPGPAKKYTSRYTIYF